MNNRGYRDVGFVLFLAVAILTSACGTLQIDTEPAASLVEPVATATEATRPEPVIEEEDVGENAPVNPKENTTPTAVLTPTLETPPIGEEGVPDNAAVARPAEITMLDDTWFQYTNYQQGFLINFPRTKIHFLGSCKWNEENGDHSYRPEPSHVPVKIFEDEDTVYITSEYQHELSGETRETKADGGTRIFFSECQSVLNSLELLRDPEYYQEMWQIVVSDVHDDQELDAFIKSRYGSSCSLGEKVASTQDGVYDVTIQGDGKDLSETSCPLNYGTVVKYYPEGNKVIAWNTGQASTFAADVSNTVTYDQEMVDSFRFLTGETDEVTVDSVQADHSGWRPYTNGAVGYSLMYPANAEIMGANHEQAVEFVGPIVGEEHWPWFFVQHFDSEFYRPPAGTDVRQWIAESNIPYEPLEQEETIGGLPAVHFAIEASPQAYARDDYYVIHDDQLILISILHGGGLQDWQMYEQFLASITFGEGNL